MLGTLFFSSRFSAACKEQQKNTIILRKKIKNPIIFTGHFSLVLLHLLKSEASALEVQQQFHCHITCLQDVS